MEIKVTIDSGDAQIAAGQPGAAAVPFAAGAAEQAGDGAGPPPSVAAATAAIGAIDAGPAHIPPGQTGQPLADIAANSQAQMTGVGQERALAAGAAPGYAHETAEVIEAVGEQEG